MPVKVYGVLKTFMLQNVSYTNNFLEMWEKKLTSSLHEMQESNRQKYLVMKKQVDSNGVYDVPRVSNATRHVTTLYRSWVIPMKVMAVFRRTSGE